MKTKFTIALMLVFLITSCVKKTHVNGVVYSKHSIPVPNVSINLLAFHSSEYPVKTYTAVAITDNNGAYEFDFDGGNVEGQKTIYNIKCYGDSGGYNPIFNNPIKRGKTNTIDIYLH